jgi:hypothetical protein
MTPNAQQRRYSALKQSVISTMSIAVLVVACGGSPGSTMTATAPPISSPAPTAPASSPAPTASPMSARTPNTLDGSDDQLSAGTYRITLDPAGPRELPPILITVPEGWSNFGGWGISGPPGNTEPDGDEASVAVSFWDVTRLYGHPCDSSGTLFDPGPTVGDLADAIAEIPLRNATEPIDVTVDGYDGKYVEWSVPDDADFSACDTGDYVSWKSTGWNTERYHQGPGQVDRLWILNVQGVRLVIDAFHWPSTSSEHLEELRGVVESIRFED